MALLCRRWLTRYTAWLILLPNSAYVQEMLVSGEILVLLADNKQRQAISWKVVQQ